MNYGEALLQDAFDMRCRIDELKAENEKLRAVAERACVSVRVGGMANAQRLLDALKDAGYLKDP